MYNSINEAISSTKENYFFINEDIDSALNEVIDVVDEAYLTFVGKDAMITMYIGNDCLTLTEGRHTFASFIKNSPEADRIVCNIFPKQFVRLK